MSELGKIIGQFVAGSFNKLIIRQKSDQVFEIGQLFIAGNSKDDYAIYQINDLVHESQVPQAALELMAGYNLEREKSDLRIYEPELRTYVLALARPLVRIRHDAGRYIIFLPKSLPQFFGNAFEIQDDHLAFLKESVLENPMMIGTVRSGSKILKTPVSLEAKEVLTHHILIPATTGRGKSNLVKVILYNLLENHDVGKLVFDPHDEYYSSLRQHPKSSEFIRYYTTRHVPHCIDLKFNLKLLHPGHVLGVIDLTPAQQEALIVYYRRFEENWIEHIFLDDPAPGVREVTLNALRRRLGILLNINVLINEDGEEQLIENGIYTFNGHETIIHDIIEYLKDGKTVIIDTSLFGGNEEIFVASIITEAIYWEYRQQKFNDQLKNLPVITIVLEEAPRVIGKNVLETRENIFGTIAREGRKFQIGLIAITQLPSLIPREILANMNTKIILGNEMGPERDALIHSSAQDLSQDSQNIASLDKGEAIITSNFTKFAIPIKIPLFEELVKQDLENRKKENVSSVKKRSPF
ncbi:MAG: ATP-binding protein [Promethearchaeota archaeon]